MHKQSQPVHGFTVNVGGIDGQPTIFVFKIFPDNVAGLEPAEPSGAMVKLKQADGNTIDLTVTQSVEDIRALMGRCKALDAGNGGS